MHIGLVESEILVKIKFNEVNKFFASHMETYEMGMCRDGLEK